MNALLTALFALPLAIAPPPPTSPPPTVAISAGSAIAIDAATGAVLFQKNADEQRPVASLTKMMTAIVAQDGGLLGADIRISADAASYAWVQRGAAHWRSAARPKSAARLAGFQRERRRAGPGPARGLRGVYRPNEPNRRCNLAWPTPASKIPTA